ncbi:DinB family protein [Mucilaginibacter sp. 21P]|uniref:DinB family protein n=1 Tax=Mucilaginibacter sp. 21P TaxID=2778902 RepID=UPI001C5A1B06|nr:DinB family protein [Mucilaginibacter sp. 21P]QXV64043.1 DinB family protein [Mucilaginibacter sp. 21P]
MHSLLVEQYRLVRSSREALFNYTESIAVGDLNRQLPSFNNESMSSILAHVATTYLSWLVTFAQQQEVDYFNFEDCKDITVTRATFGHVDGVVTGFLESFKQSLNLSLTLEKRQGVILNLSPLELFTHVITHEFHHKGQLVNMSRQLGYIPVDTDVIRT